MTILWTPDSKSTHLLVREGTSIIRIHYVTATKAESGSRFVPANPRSKVIHIGRMIHEATILMDLPFRPYSSNQCTGS